MHADPIQNEIEAKGLTAPLSIPNKVARGLEYSDILIYQQKACSYAHIGGVQGARVANVAKKKYCKNNISITSIDSS